MHVITHGTWSRYSPAALPKGAPSNTIFCRSDSDGADWYEYRRTNFNADSVKLNAYYREEAGGLVVGAAVYEADRLFPDNQTVLEVTGYTGNDPQADFGNKLYNPADATFSDWTPERKAMPPSPTETKILNALDAIVARLEKLEKKG